MQNDASRHSGFDGLIYPTLSAIAFGIVTVRLSTVALPRRLWVAVLQRVGQNSFSMYIMHFAAINVLQKLLSPKLAATIASRDLRLALTFPLLVLLSYVAARITGRLIEAPGMQLGRWLTQRHRP